MATKRREFLKAVGAGATAMAIPGWANGQTQRRITFTNPWLPDASGMFSHIAKNKGYFAKRGIEVEIQRGFGSVAAAQAVGAGKFDYGVAALPAAITQAAKGLPVVATGSVHYDGTMGVVALADGPVKTLRDLEGRRLGSTVVSGEYPFLSLFLRNAGVDQTKIQRVQFDAQVRDRALVQKEVDAISGFAGSILPGYAVQNIESRFFPYAAHGVKLYGMSVLTQTERLQKDPALTQAVTEAILEGMALTLRSPDEALEAFIAENKELGLTAAGRDRSRMGMSLFALTCLVGEARKNGLGWFDPASVRAQADMVASFVAAKEDKVPPLDALFTNRFAGSVRLTDAEWAAAEKRLAPFRKIMPV